MPDDDIQKLKEDYPEFFKKSAGVIEFAMSKGTSSQIMEICLRNGVKDEEKISGVAYRITWVLLGKLPKKNLAFALIEGLGLEQETAQKIQEEAEQLIFSAAPKETEVEQKPSPSSEEPPKKPPAKDTYRELAE